MDEKTALQYERLKEKPFGELTRDERWYLFFKNPAEYKRLLRTYLKTLNG